jgi:hypothetical protein
MMLEIVAVTTTVVVAIAVGAAVIALLLVALIVWLSRGGGTAANGDERLAELVADMNQRMESMVSDLSVALERAQEEGRRNRMLGELAGTIDLDEVLTRTLDAAGAMPGVDAALARIDNGDETPIIATLGLSTEEAQRQAIAGPPGGPEARSISLVYQYPSSRRTTPRSGSSPSSRDCGRTAGTRTRCGSSRSSPSVPAPRSRTRSGSARRGSSPTSTR